MAALERPSAIRRQYLSLPGRKQCNGVDFPGQELRHDLRVEGAPTLSDSLEGVHELGYFAVGGTRGVGRPRQVVVAAAPTLRGTGSAASVKHN